MLPTDCGRQELTLPRTKSNFDNTSHHDMHLHSSSTEPGYPDSISHIDQHSTLVSGDGILEWLEQQDTGPPENVPLLHEHLGARGIDASSNRQPTPSLVMSPRTTHISDFEFESFDTDLGPSRTTVGNDGQRQPSEPDSGTMRPTSFCSKCASSKTRIKKTEHHKTSTSHPHKCKYCPMRFRQQGERRKHQKNVHGPKDKRPYACKGCGKRFNWPKDLLRHEKRVHKESTTVDRSEHDISQSLFNEAKAELNDISDEVDENEVPEAVFDSNMNSSGIGVLESFMDVAPDDDQPFDLSFQDFPQDWLCETTPEHDTFPRTLSPGEGSAPHRGARV